MKSLLSLIRLIEREREEDLTQTQHVDKKGFLKLAILEKSSVERALNNPPGDDLMIK